VTSLEVPGRLEQKKVPKPPVILEHFQKAAFDMSILGIFLASYEK
jgi:hypothetical protein